ncbi:MAG TPA: phosphoribosyltransferase family protein [Dehalococcoidia bacterium]|nr:phosphoribosyltransferase family protein [Dehalococcoidia bacterium]
MRAAFVYEGSVRDAVLALKYEGLSSLDRPLLAAIDLDTVTPPDVVVDVVTAVPMSGRRRRRRGYNQAEALGRALASRLELPFDAQLLSRVRHVPQQARQPDLAARRANVAGAFGADRKRLAGRAVLVVDDVTTSGATLAACAEALQQAEASAVYVWALARED